jgi:glycosyltransferase involved in cell wall biosynthesis
MKALIIHNEYGKLSGEEAVVEAQAKLLKENGHEVLRFEMSSANIPNIRFGKLQAFFSGIYSFSSRRQIRKLLAGCKLDVVHIHNLFPLISPSILPECKKAGVPVVMTVHNYRLVCPNGLHMVNGMVCEKCSGGREYWCLLKNCESSLFKSLGYALRNYVARRKRVYLNNVTMYAALTEFQREKLIRNGFPAERILVIPNMVNPNGVEVSDKLGHYVGYAGRISPEKGMPTLIEAARACSDIQFKAAGAYDHMPYLPRKAPQNFKFSGHLNKAQLDKLYTNSRMIVLPSICFEGFPSVLLESMIQSKPVIASRIGGLPEIVEDGVTGLLFEPGNAEDLAEKIRYLWDRPELCKKMGRAGREKALREYSPEKYYERLMAVYKKAGCEMINIYDNCPLVSVIMCMYNEEKYVGDAIDSILNQTYKNFELIIVDDYSTDKSVQICKTFKDDRIRIYTKTGEPRYPACSRNIAIRMARGEYVVIHDADDYSEPTRIEKQLNRALELPGRRIVGCSIRCIEAGREWVWKMPETHAEIIKGFKRIFNRTAIVAGTILAPKNILLDIPYRTQFKCFEDWDLLLRIFESGRAEFCNCQEPLYTYCIRPKGVLQKPEWSDYNIYDRNCQSRRRKGIHEFQSIEEFFEHLSKHPLEKWKWLWLKKLIELRLRIRSKK